MKILAVSRGENFSPNLVDNDAKILAAVVGGLRECGHNVVNITESDLIDGNVPSGCKLIVNMCRDSRSLSILSRMESEGSIVVNSPQGIANCNRECLTHLLLDAGVPHPDSLIVNTSEAIGQRLNIGGYTDCWVKRADCQTMQKDDVVFCRGIDDAERVIADYRLRGIERAVISKHLEGDLVKFYGVENSDFFCWFYPFDRGHSKFGYEEINGKSQGIEFDITKLRKICSLAARTLRVVVYGGDAVIAADGSIRIIDFNDWPSFSPCREEGARAIVQSIESIIYEIQQRRISVNA